METHENPGSRAWADTRLDIETRISALLEAMTREEKIRCLSTHNDLPRLGIRGSAHVEGLHGLTLGGPGNWGREWPNGENRPQVTTTFPQSSGLGETWDPELVRRAAEQESIECRFIFQDPRFMRGGIVVRAPNADLARDIRWGRTEESFGEDAFHVGTMAAAFTRGLQGDDPKYWRCAALLKHFLANSNEDERSTSSSDFDEVQWREYYSVPFRMAIEEGGSRAFMAAYNSWNSIPCTVHPMLKEITRDEWGMDGIICTDGGALSLLVSDHRWYQDLASAAAGCLKAGINQFLDNYVPYIGQALDEGLLSEGDLDAALRPTFRVLARLGLLDPQESVPYASIKGGDLPWEKPETRELVRQVTRASVVLLKNKSPAEGLAVSADHARPVPRATPLLPVDPDRVRRVAVIGKRAGDVLLDWYSGTPPYTVSAFQGIKAGAPEGMDVFWVPSPVALGKAAQVGNPHAGHDREAAAAMDYGRVSAAAASADLAIVVVGNHPTGDAGWAVCAHPTDGKEAVDRKEIGLEEESMIRTVHRANPNTLVVVLSSFPVAMPWVDHHVPAILHMANNSQELGNALADVIFGRYNPSGRLAHTWPRRLEDLPPRLDYDLRKGRTHAWFGGTPLYHFGYGLSYSDFKWSGFRLVSRRPSPTVPAGLGKPGKGGQARPGAGTLVFALDLANEGPMDGEEVVQIYARRPASAMRQPSRKLVGFAKVMVKAGATARVEISVRMQELVNWDPDFHTWVLEPGMVKFMACRHAGLAEAACEVMLD